MSNNKLLKENTIRRFMKLANVNSLTDNFISERYGKEDLQEGATTQCKTADGKTGFKMPKENGEGYECVPCGDRRVASHCKDLKEEFSLFEQDMPEMEEDEPEMDEPEMDEPEMDEPEMDMDMDDEPEAGAADISLTEEEARLLIDLGERLSAAMDEDMEPEDDMEGLDDLEDEIDEPEDDMGDDMGDDLEGEEEPGLRDYMQENKAAIVNEVLKRVTKRIVSEKLNRR